MIALTMAWVVLFPLAVLAVLSILAYTQRPDPSSLHVAVEPVPPSESARVAELPAQSTDYLVSIVEYEVAPAATVILLPVVALWIAWLVARRRDHEPPT
jgi:hypothetical protein